MNPRWRARRRPQSGTPTNPAAVTDRGCGQLCASLISIRIVASTGLDLLLPRSPLAASLNFRWAARSKWPGIHRVHWWTSPASAQSSTSAVLPAATYRSSRALTSACRARSSSSTSVYVRRPVPCRRVHPYRALAGQLGQPCVDWAVAGVPGHPVRRHEPLGRRGQLGQRGVQQWLSGRRGVHDRDPLDPPAGQVSRSATASSIRSAARTAYPTYSSSRTICRSRSMFSKRMSKPRVTRARYPVTRRTRAASRRPARRTGQPG